MSDPLVPNYKKGVGQLVTTRYDFQNHVDGYSFKHNSRHITLSPAINIGSIDQTTVYDALTALNSIIAPSFTVPTATSSILGGIKLLGDISGSATNIRVTKLQNFAVSALPPSDGQVLTWDNIGNSWKPATIISSFIAAGDLFGNNTSQTVTRIQGNAVSSSLPNNNDVLTWVAGNNSWEPVDYTPNGTGFATVTSGVFDVNSTANIRYTSGRLQVDTTIQFKNGVVTGDLAWTPSTTNKSLSFPDITDVLVSKNSTDIFTNKTINASNNIITDTGTIIDDILVSNGTKFIRKAKGSDGTFLGVSGGILGYYSATISTPTGTGFASITSGAFDSTATPNIRYNAGKFQTDQNIQFKNGSIIGELSWSPNTLNKTLTLPDITDTLVGKTTTDIFTNKTFDVASAGNFLLSASQSAGDLLKNNGAKFVRFQRGNAFQVLRVNSSANDLEWATPSTTSTGAINTIQVNDGFGGFLGATNVTSGVSYIGIGATISSSGYLRFAFGTSDSIISSKDSGGIDREIISRTASSNTYQIGPNNASTLSLKINGDTINVKANTQFTIATSTNSASIDVSSTGKVLINPNGFLAINADINGDGNAAVIKLFSAPTIASSVKEIISIGNSSSAPTATPSGGGYLWVESGALKYKGSGGTLTTVGPAEPHCKKCGRDYMHEWQNDKYGYLSSCMPCLLEALEAIGVNVNAFSTRQLT